MASPAERNESGANEPDTVRLGEVSFATVAHIVQLLEPLTSEARSRVLNTVVTWLNIPQLHPTRANEQAAPSMKSTGPTRENDYPFAGRPEISPKEFLLEKDPSSDIERMACLAYYLTHFRDLPSFKTEDLVRLNTESAQRRFSNASQTAKNAMREGFFVQASVQGARQLSAFGEQYIQALPNRDAAKQVRTRMSSRRARPSSQTARRQLDESAEPSLIEEPNDPTDRTQPN
jgi:hypothetical protein